MAALLCLFSLALIAMPLASAAEPAGLSQFSPVEAQVNLVENGAYSRAVGGLPTGWTLEGSGRPYIFNRGAYHAAGIEVTDRRSPGAMLLSQPIRIERPEAAYVLTGLLAGGAAETDEVVPTDSEKKGGGVLELRCYDASGKRLANAAEFSFQGARRGMHLYRELNDGRIFQRCQLPAGTATVRVAWGLRQAIGRVNTDDLAFYRETGTGRPDQLAVAAYDANLRSAWLKAGDKGAILVDGVRDPGPKADINPVLAGVWKYPFNNWLLQYAPKGVIFDLGGPCAVDGIEVSMATSTSDVVDRQAGRFDPEIIRVAFSDDGINFGPEMELLYRPELMQAEALMRVYYQGFRRAGRFVRLAGAESMAEVRFFGRAEPVSIGYRPLMVIRNGQVAYGVEVELDGLDDQSFMARVPKGNIHRIDRRRWVDVTLITPAGRLSESLVFDNFTPEKIMRRQYFTPNPAALAGGADLELAYHDRVQVWDSPTTHSLQTDQAAPALVIKSALPAQPQLAAVNQELAALKKQLDRSRGEEKNRVAALAAAQLAPKLKNLGTEAKSIEEFFSQAGSPRTLGPELLPSFEIKTPDGKFFYRVAVKAPDIFLISKYDSVTGRYISNAGHSGNYVTAGEVAMANPKYLLQRRYLKDGESFEAAAAAADGWENVSVSMVLERGFRALFRISFELPEAGDWTMCCKTLWQFPESKMILNGQAVGTPFRWGQQTALLRNCRAGANELLIQADASQARINLETAPYQASYFHLYWLKTSQPVAAFGESQVFLPGLSGKATVVYAGGAPVVVDFPRETRFQPAAARFADLLKPTSETGPITTRPSDGDYVDKNGSRFFVWGGHWNHLHSKEGIDLAVRMLPTMGVSTTRNIYDESEADEATGKWRPEALDQVFYQVAQLGKAGIYQDICLHSYGWYTNPEGAFYKVDGGNDPRYRGISRLWNPVYLRAQKNYATELFTTVNPYNGKKLIDDPTMISVEIANEDYGLGARRFDFEELPEPEKTLVRKRFNSWLLKKYKSREKLAEAWALEPLAAEENPAQGNIHFPPQFKTVAKSPNFFLNWDAEGRTASPRTSDAMEWCRGEVYDFLKTMYDHLRGLGVKCSISWCGFSTYELQMTNLHPYLSICDSLGGSGYGSDNNFRSLERWYVYGSFNHFWPKSTHVREWSSWNQGADVAASTNGLVTAGLFGLAHGLDHWSHHKLGYAAYPSLEQEAVNSINPDVDQRRAAFSFVGWAFRRARIPVDPPRLLIGLPKTESCYGGLNSPCDTQPLKGGYTFLYDQVRMDYYVFDQVYDGPEDMVVMHEGRSPSGDYRKAKHAILWSHGISDPTGRNPRAREEWFALHGIHFEPGERWKKTDRVLAFNCDLVDDPELNRVVYDTLVAWGVKLPFSRDEIHKIYANLDRSIEVNTDLGRMKVDRDDFQAWLGQNHGEQTQTSLMSVSTDADQVQVLAVPFDTGSFKTARQLVLWSRTDANVKLTADFDREPEIWAVNWTGYRKQKVSPLAWDKKSVTVRFTHDLDVHYYEILR